MLLQILDIDRFLIISWWNYFACVVRLLYYHFFNFVLFINIYKSVDISVSISLQLLLFDKNASHTLQNNY